MNSSVVAAGIVELGLVTYRASKAGTLKTNPVPHLPMPSEVLSVVVVYGGLSIVTGQGEALAGALGWGLVVATLLKFWNPGGTVAAHANPAGSSTSAASSSTIAASGGSVN